jgi:hypothetical protein
VESWPDQASLPSFQRFVAVVLEQSDLGRPGELAGDRGRSEALSSLVPKQAQHGPIENQRRQHNEPGNTQRERQPVAPDEAEEQDEDRHSTEEEGRGRPIRNAACAPEARLDRPACNCGDHDDPEEKPLHPDVHSETVRPGRPGQGGRSRRARATRTGTQVREGWPSLPCQL